MIPDGCLCIDRIHLPCGNAFHLQVSAVAEQADVKMFWVIFMPGDGRLTIVGKDLDHVLVDEDAQGEVFRFL